MAGFDVEKQRDDVRRHIGLVFQDTTLDGYLTAQLNLRFHAELYGMPREAVPDRMEQVLRMVGLWERRTSKVNTFSGGMKRRLEIARGLMHSPRVLFLDEPTVGLDPQTRSSIWEYIDQLRQQEQITIFLTTHYMDEAENCDRIAIMDEGQIVALDTPAALKAQVGADRVTIRTADDEAALAALPGATLTGEGIVVEVEGGEAYVPRLFATLDVPITNVSVRRPSLDDVSCRSPARPSATPKDPSGSCRRCSRLGCGDDDAGRGRGAGADVRIRPAGDPDRRLPRPDPHLPGPDPVRLRAGAAAALPVRPRLGTVVAESRTTGSLDLRTFMYPGVLATSTLFTAIFSAVSIVWDREFGFLREMLVAPVRRSSIILGKALGGATIATVQSVVVLLLAPLVHVPISFGLVLTLLGEVFLLSFTLTALGLAVVVRITQVQTVMGLMQVLLLPLSFLSGALYPLSGLPTWLSILTRLNPLTYAVNPVRTAVFDRLDVSPAVRARLAPPLTWGSWPVPIWLQLVLVAVIGLLLMGLAIRQFARTE